MLYDIVKFAAGIGAGACAQITTEKILINLVGTVASRKERLVVAVGCALLSNLAFVAVSKTVMEQIDDVAIPIMEGIEQAKTLKAMAEKLEVKAPGKDVIVVEATNGQS